jgi:hypothetical protein
MGWKFRAALLLAICPAIVAAARLTDSAGQAFETYIKSVEARLPRDGNPRTGVNRTLLAGGTWVEPVNGGSWPVSGGLLHHWRAAALVPGASANDMLALLRDYNHLDRYYAPDVVYSRALTVTADGATMLMRFRKHRVVTVVLDAEFDTRSALAGVGRGYSRSRSTHIWQIDQPGSVRERRRPEGDDDGFLWRLNSYWSFAERPEGIVIECEAVSLTRDVPAGLAWLVTPVIQTLPRSSIEFTLTATRNALAANAIGRHQ